MRIDGSSLTLAAARDYRREHQVTESLVVTRQARARVDPPGLALGRALGSPPGQWPDGSAPGTRVGSTPGGDGAGGVDEADVGNDPRLLVVKMLLERLTGRPIETLDPADLRPRSAPVDLPAAVAPAAASTGPVAPTWGVAYDRREVLHEEEHVDFSATGTVRLADGSSVAFSVELSMDRVYHEETTVSVRAGAAAKDPLVLNLDGGAARLTGAQVSLDLDRDGVLERFAALAPSSAFLVADRNGNGTVDDGGELFGPASGDGFAELAAADADANGWIDESDPIWRQLALWTVTPGEPDRRLVSLTEAGVGAIAVASVSTPFSLQEGDRQLGAVRATGVYLREGGGAGTVQQIDLVV